MASQSCKHLSLFIDGLPTASQERIAATASYAVKVQLHATTTLKQVQELMGEADAAKKAALGVKVKKSYEELQDLRAKLAVVVRTNKLPEELGRLEAIGDAA